MLEFALLAALVAGQQKPVIKQEKRVDPYRLVRLSAENVPPKAGVVWRVRPSKPIDRSSQPDRLKLEFVGPPGTYEVEILVVTVDPSGQVGIEEQSTTVVIGEAQPPPPQPSTFASKVKSAYLGLAEDGKVKSAETMAALYRQVASGLGGSSDTLNVLQAKTWGELWDTMARAAASLEISGKLVPVQQIIQARLQAELPWKMASGEILDDVGKVKAAKVFLEVAQALEGCK